MKNTTRIFSLLLVAAGWCCLLPTFSSCGGEAPIDAETRMEIDSTVAAQSNYAGKELDSLCVVYEKTLLPQMIDSIKKVRLKEIERQLKTVPK